MATQTIQQTGKFWKLLRGLGGLTLIVSGLIWWADPSVGSPTVTGIAFGVWLFGRLGSWWFHG